MYLNPCSGCGEGFDCVGLKGHSRCYSCVKRKRKCSPRGDEVARDVSRRDLKLIPLLPFESKSGRMLLQEPVIAAVRLAMKDDTPSHTLKPRSRALEGESLLDLGLWCGDRRYEDIQREIKAGHSTFWEGKKSDRASPVPETHKTSTPRMVVEVVLPLRQPMTPSANTASPSSVQRETTGSRTIAPPPGLTGAGPSGEGQASAAQPAEPPSPPHSRDKPTRKKVQRVVASAGRVAVPLPPPLPSASRSTRSPVSRRGSSRPEAAVLAFAATDARGDELSPGGMAHAQSHPWNSLLAKRLREDSPTAFGDLPPRERELQSDVQRYEGQIADLQAKMAVAQTAHDGARYRRVLDDTKRQCLSTHRLRGDEGAPSGFS